MDIGENIRLRRAQLRLTQVDLSKKTGIKQPTISAIEKGVNKPTIETAALISDALGCTVSDLIGQTMTSESENPELSNLLLIFDQLNDAGKRFLIQQAESILQQSAFRKDGSASLVG